MNNRNIIGLYILIRDKKGRRGNRSFEANLHIVELASGELDISVYLLRCYWFHFNLLHSKHYIVSMEHIAEWVHFSLCKGEIGSCRKIITTTQNERKHTHAYGCFGLFVYPSHTHKQMKTFRERCCFQTVSLNFMLPEVPNACHKRYAKLAQIFLLWLTVLLMIVLMLEKKKQLNSLDTSRDCSSF